jgi:hypothetical protein
MSWIKKVFKKWKMNLLMRKEYRRIIVYQQYILNEKITNWTTKLEELDQSKVYFITVSNRADAESIDACFKEIRSRMKWTPPIIIILITNKVLGIKKTTGEKHGRK